MKKHRFYSFIILLFGMFILASCSTDDPGFEEKARYYVKYEVTFKTQHTNTIKNISFTTENSTENISFTEWVKTKSWEGTYGPVDKNFKATINCVVPDYNYDCEIHARIYLSREKEPFVIKSEGIGKYSLFLQANIDF